MRKPKAKVTRAEVAFARHEGKYWDDHSLAEAWTQTRAVEMDVELQASTLLIHLEPRLAARLESAARKKRLSLETWLNRAVERELAHSSS
jgi:predicted HicB family RNase H-like nuclease